MEPHELLDLHLTRLVGWILQTVGKALLLSSAVSGVFAALAAYNGTAGSLAIAIALGPIIFGFMLMTADAPLPLDVEQ